MTSFDASAGAAPLVSVLTPTWNRADYLQRVWEGLSNQTFADFEWLVANDGSDDHTRGVIRELAGRSAFPIVFIDADTHIGKPRMDNELIRNARGRFVVWNDSDDYLVPGALERLVEVWHTIPEENSADYIGLTALCASEDGAIQSSNTPSDSILDTTWNELSDKFQVHGDKLFFVRTDAIRGRQFAEVDFMVTESSFWNDFSDMRTKFIPEVLKVVDRSAPNRISYSGKMEYCRGKTYGIALSDTTEAARSKPLHVKLWKAITYFRYSLHGELTLRRAASMWNGNLPSPLFFAMYPLGLAMATKDRIQGKVRRTHRDFDEARHRVHIDVTTFPPAREVPATVGPDSPTATRGHVGAY